MSKNAEIRFSVCDKQKYPCLHQVALRYLKVPVSSVWRERDFSFINRLFAAERSCLKDDMINDNAFLKRFFDFQDRSNKQFGWWDNQK